MGTSAPTSIRTKDGADVAVGSVVFAYYDGAWGTVLSIDVDGWADVALVDGRTKSYDGPRLSVAQLGPFAGLDLPKPEPEPEPPAEVVRQERVLAYLRSKGERTSGPGEVAGALGIYLPTVVRELEALEAVGLVRSGDHGGPRRWWAVDERPGR